MVIKKIPLQRFAIHVLLGLVAKFLPIALTSYYFVFVAYAAIRIINTSDRNMVAARYVLYVAGLEIVYRISGYTIVYEFGKYACMLLLSLGLIFGGRKSNTKPFFVYILLLIPAISLTEFGVDINEYRNVVMFSLSGPITLALSGMYFYGRTLSEDQLWHIFRTAVLPAVSLLVLLFLGPSVDSVNLMAESNFALSGGFGPNQVSTALGFFAILLAFANWNGKVLTFNKVMDYVLIVLLLFRALLTFSRGGVFAFLLTLLGTAAAMLFFSREFRKHAIRYSGYLLALLMIGFGTFFVANKLTNDWLLYRYRGVSTYEVNTGYEKTNHSYLSGRENIADEELTLFKDNWFTGVGAGMSKIVRETTSNESVTFASHSEFSRLLAEHGILGVFALVLLLAWLPIRRILRFQSSISRQFFFLFFQMGVLTMLHAAMRLALPGIITGMSFSLILGASAVFSRERFGQG